MHRRPGKLLRLTRYQLTLSPAPMSFCKCTCFSNSTIIPLDPAKSGSPSSAFDNVLRFYERAWDGIDETQNVIEEELLRKRNQNYRSLSCNDCSRKFCLNYELPTCKGAKEDDVFTTCFRTYPLYNLWDVMEEPGLCDRRKKARGLTRYFMVQNATHEKTRRLCSFLFLPRAACWLGPSANRGLSDISR